MSCCSIRFDSNALPCAACIAATVAVDVQTTKKKYNALHHRAQAQCSAAMDAATYRSLGIDLPHHEKVKPPAHPHTPAKRWWRLRGRP